MMRIDGIAVEPKGTVLEACRAAGIPLPAFCWNEKLRSGGHCRACLVEMDGRFMAACTTPSREGASIATRSARLEAYRRDLGELIVAASKPGGRVGETLREWGVRGDRYAAAGSQPRRDETHPYLRIDLSACILCRACVRACEEIQGQFVYAVRGRGAEASLTWTPERFGASDCVSCGACLGACPTEAISSVDLERVRTAPTPIQTRRTTCGYCGVGCGLEVQVAGDRVVRIEGADSPVNRGHLCVKGRFAHGFSRHPDRLRTPLVRRGGRLVEAGWDEAVGLVARELSRFRGAVAGLSSSRCTNEENYLFQKWLRAGLGTNDVDCCARVCHAPSAAGMRVAFGTGAATNSLADIDRADLLLVVGANPTEAHPVTGARLRRAALEGSRLIVVDPRRTELAEIADLHLQLRPGTNVPLLNALARVLVEEDLVDHDFLAARAEGWKEFRAFALATSLEWAAGITGVPAGRIREAAHLYARARRPMALHGLGVTEHLQGSEAVMLLCNLALLRGAIGREGVGINPLRGQNNVQGSADMGCQPDFLPGYQSVEDPEMREKFGRVWGRPVPERPGRTIPRMYGAALDREIRAMVILGEDVAQTDPDTGQVRAALSALDFLVVQELFPSETAKLAHVVLPGASFLEKDGTFTNGERRIQRVRMALPPVAGARPDWQVLLELMNATGLPQSFRSPAEIMAEIAGLTPIYAGVRYHRLDGEGLQWPVPSLDHPGTPILHREEFTRGRGRLSRVTYLPSPQLRDGLTLVTGRRLVHYNAGTMTRRTPDLELVPEERLDMNPDDAADRGIGDGARVSVASDSGEIEVRARLSPGLQRGTVFLSFHFPECETNRLTSTVTDRFTDCPEYKITAVEVRPR